MKLKCLGAGQEVGRSGILILGSDNVLFDYGLKLHPKYRDKKNKDKYRITHEEKYTEAPLKIKEKLDAVILSHAHLDHSGDIPALYKNDNPNLFVTEGTLDLSNLLWKDTLKIARFERRDPPYYRDHMIEANKSAFYLDLKQTVEITDNSKLTFYDAGHIVGSTISVLEMDNKKIMYTGDFRNTRSSLFNGYDNDLPEVDYLIIESTYGDADHKPREQVEKEVIDAVKATLNRKGIVMLAAFAIERSQELIALLYKNNIKAPIYVDGMGTKATRIFLEYPEYFKDHREFKKAVNSVELVTNHRMRKEMAKDSSPKVIITTAGMLEGGPIMFYLKQYGDNKNNLLMTTGYQVEGTNGHRLHTTGKMFIDDELFEPLCEIKHNSLSAHPDQGELIELVNLVNPKKVICIHGDPDAITKFRKELKDEGYETEAPKVGDTITL